MTTSSWITVGAVFRARDDDRPRRVLVHRDGMVMYDYWLPHLGAWSMADLQEVRRRTYSFHLATASDLPAYADHLHDEPLTADEKALFRPDLPFAVGQRRELAWPAGDADVARFAAEFRPDTVAVDAPEIYLGPFGAKGGTRREERTSADDGVAFTERDLMRKAAELQAPHLRPTAVVAGVGIYRHGLHRGRPSFYIWGAQSRLETHLAERLGGG